MATTREQPAITDSGIAVEPVYRAEDAGAPQPDPGAYPYTRGVYPTMYRGRLWTMRQYAGFSSARESNQRYRYLLAQGQTGLSVAFDLPTQLGLDSDDPRAEGEVGKVGVAIDSLRDMQTLFADIPLDKVTTSMTINAPASVLLLLYELVAEGQGVSPDQIGGTIQNDILKEYAARGTYIFPPRPSMRLITDTFAYCQERIPRWNTISISGYHIREAGATAVQEIAFTLADGVAYVDAAIKAGLDVDEFAPRLSFFFVANPNFLEEVAKFRAARRMWATIMKERFGAKKASSQMLRFHTQTSGASLTAQQPLNNVVRTTIEALAAVLGGTQSLHTNGFDEALSLPTQQAATLALRTQQIIGFESGVVDTADPLAGSYVVEALTDELERQARALMAQIDAMGGAVDAVERGWMQEQIADSAYAYQRRVESGERAVVGVNRFVGDEATSVPIFKPDENVAREQAEGLAQLRADRDSAAVAAALADLKAVAEGTGSLLPPMREALRRYATVGEVCGTLREVWGEYRPEVRL
ncbi:methylmalonyl-CoA mutase [Oscillochloris sp. ZM17-4]|uniref:acyl-CoA mutase large subunit family protein n=1 Tax=Oscillochloris sp. ZM17-4 TaxID=2866714 RepID=UPI001C72F592|nr:methylmalonyl-CoA mutase family protein [Oscillochloris sp. ZM17-4]MBX0328265.1 methylmalonyl-CoA mutase [Oscillochloris sp. ZM17-4]